MVKSPPAMQETWVRSLGGEDPLEEGMAPRSSSLAWRIPGTGWLDGLQSLGSQKSWTCLGNNSNNMAMKTPVLSEFLEPPVNFVPEAKPHWPCLRSCPE